MTKINREDLDYETTRRLGLLILAFINISRQRGRSEHFLSGLEAAYSIVSGADDERDISLYSQGTDPK
jgi:hypothetical protein